MPDLPSNSLPHHTAWLILVLTLGLVSPAVADEEFTFMLHGNLLTVRAKRTPLSKIMREFVDSGVRARIDPEINPPITARFTDKELGTALRTLLRSVNFELLWEVVHGPLGPIRRLAEIQVYRPGKRSLIREIERTRDTKQVGSETHDRVYYVKEELLLRVKKGTTPEQVNALLRTIGGTLVESVPALGIYRVRLVKGSDAMAVLEQLKGNDIVEQGEPNFVLRAPAPNLQDVGQRAVFPDDVRPISERGTAPVAVLDSGLDPTAGLNDAVVASYDATRSSTNLSDSLGHGTQMALIASGYVDPFGGTRTVGEQAVPIIAIRAFDDDGNTTNFQMFESIEYALAQGAKVLNLSWNSPNASGFMEEAIRAAQDKGIIVVAAAGNEPLGRPVYPAAFPGVIAVAAADQNGRIWESSNYGDFVDLTAPGFADLPVGHAGEPGLYAGTSISSAYAANIIGQYIARHPDTKAEDVVQAINAALTKHGAAASTAEHGAGMLDDAAVDRLLETK